MAMKNSAFKPRQGNQIQKIRPVPWSFIGFLFVVAAGLANLPDEWLFVDGLGKIVFLVGAGAAVHTATYRWDLFLAVGKQGLFLYCCSACLMPFLLIPFVWLVPWSILLTLVGLSWIGVVGFGFSVGARRKQALIRELEACSEIEYPFDFFMGVSRRFSSDAAVELHNELVRPILEAQGDVLECWHASESFENPDYWMARMDLLFTISDIHLLLDIDSSPATRHEVKLSHKLVLRPNSNYLSLVFPADHDIHKAYSVPFCVHVSKSGPASRINFSLRRINIRLRSDRDREAFPQRLSYAIGIVKGMRLLNAAQLREGGGSILNASWQAQDYDKLTAFLAARRQVAALLLPPGREALLELMEGIDPLKKEQIGRMNSVIRLLLETEESGRAPSFQRIFSSIRGMIFYAVPADPSKGLRLFGSVLASLLATVYSPPIWLSLKLFGLKKRWRSYRS